METRHMRAECRATGDTGRTFEGEAIVYGIETLIGSLRWGFFETIAPGAARDTIANDDVVMLDAHDTSKPIARTSAGTLKLSDTDTALGVGVPEIPATSYGNDLVMNLANRNVAGMSFGFDVLDDEWGQRTVPTSAGPVTIETRTINQIRLFEVSTTAFPAYPTTSAAVRAVLRARDGATGSVRSVADYARCVELRDTMLTEWREGKTLSSDTMNALQAVLDLIAEADAAVDAAQPLLAGLMGVPNPDADDESDDANASDETDDSTESDDTARHLSIFDRRLSAVAALTGLTKSV